MRRLPQLHRAWARVWLQVAGRTPWGRLAAVLASLGAPPYKGRAYLAQLTPRGYIAPSAIVHHDHLRLGRNVFIGERVVIFQHHGGGPVFLGDRVHLHNDTIVEVGPGGSVTIGADTHVQPRCQFTAFEAAIQIGSGVQIGPNCAFYPYDHGLAEGVPIRHQPLRTRGPIVVEDDVWFGVGVVVLSGVRIGRGAVVGAASVVTRDVYPQAVVAGVPARLIRMRSHDARAMEFLNTSREAKR